MQATTALAAVRILGIDVANLSACCAVYQAAAEEILSLAAEIDLAQWSEKTIGDGEAARLVVTVPLEQREFLDHLLDAIDALR